MKSVPCVPPPWFFPASEASGRICLCLQLRVTSPTGAARRLEGAGATPALPGLGLSSLSVGRGPWKPPSPWYVALGHQALWPQPPKCGSGLAAAHCHQK